MIDSGRDVTWREPRLRPGVGLVGASPFLLERSADDLDRIGHGTACADIVLRHAPAAWIYPVRVFGHQLETSVEAIIAGLDWSLQHGMQVVNLSLGTVHEDKVEPLYAACERARRGGMILVSAVNHDTDWSYPAVFENSLGVRAGRFRTPLEFTFHADDAVECIAEGAPEVRWLGGQRRCLFATSFAAPHITALVARLLERRPEAGLGRIRQLLARIADARRDSDLQKPQDRVADA